MVHFAMIWATCDALIAMFFRIMGIGDASMAGMASDDFWIGTVTGMDFCVVLSA